MLESSPGKLTRRTFLQGTSLLIAGTAGTVWPGCALLQGNGKQVKGPLRIGLVTDVHYADKQTRGTRNYRNSLDKLSSAVAHFNKMKVDFVVELGDFIDAADSASEEMKNLQRIESVYRQARCPRHHVLGNHCVEKLSKETFLAQCEQARSYYSFDVRGFHFIILDACFRKDGEPYGNNGFDWTDTCIPPAELEWLKADLEATRYSTVVFVHQRLYVDNNHGIANRAEVRKLFEASGKVRMVFQGHSHVDELNQINGIDYRTLAAMAEGPADNNAYAVLTLNENGSTELICLGQRQIRKSGSVR